MIENKVQQVENIKVKVDVEENMPEGGATTALRGEDSNLSRNSRTKIKAAIKLIKEVAIKTTAAIRKDVRVDTLMVN